MSSAAEEIIDVFYDNDEAKNIDAMFTFHSTSVQSDHIKPRSNKSSY